METRHRRSFDATGVIFCAFFTIAAMACAGTYSGGNGSYTNPFQLANANDLIALSETPNDWYSNFILTADIDMDPNLSGRKVFDRAVIAPDTSPEPGFQGTDYRGYLDGNGYAIRNLTIRCGDGASYIGLFGKLQFAYQKPSGVINLRLIDSHIEVGKGANCIGFLAGFTDSYVQSCKLSGIIHAGKDSTYIGGLVGLSCISLRSCTVNGNLQVESGSKIGGLAGAVEPDDSICWNGYIEDCKANVQILGVGDLTDVGGLVGVSESFRIIDCSSDGMILIFGKAVNVGGLVGRNQTRGWYNYEDCGCSPHCPAYIDGSSSSGLIVVGDHSIAVGGLAGYNSPGGCEDGGDSRIYGGFIEDCRSTQEIAAGHNAAFVGGLVGQHDKQDPVFFNQYANIRYSYFAGGSVTVGEGSHDIGGLVGGGGGNVLDSYWDMETSGLTSSAGGEGKTTAEMMTKATFAGAGWNYGDWTICEGTNYPRLKWQIPATDWVCPDGVALEDLVYLAGRWMKTGSTGAGAADADGSGKVDLGDFLILSEQWMK